MYGKIKKIRDEIAQDRVNANPPNSREVLIAGTGEVLFFDMLTGRYFQSTMEDIKRAENKVNYRVDSISCLVVCLISMMKLVFLRRRTLIQWVGT